MVNIFVDIYIVDNYLNEEKQEYFYLLQNFGDLGLRHYYEKCNFLLFLLNYYCCYLYLEYYLYSY